MGVVRQYMGDVLYSATLEEVGSSKGRGRESSCGFGEKTNEGVVLQWGAMFYVTRIAFSNYSESGHKYYPKDCLCT